MRIPFDRALLLTLGGTLLAALVVAGVTLDRRLAAELEADARKDLAMAKPLLIDRQSTQAEALRMHADQLAASDNLGQALALGDREGAIADADAMAEAWPESPVIVDLSGEVWTGPQSAGRIQPGETVIPGPYLVAYEDGRLDALALAPVLRANGQVGLAGVALPLDLSMAEILGGLTRSEVILLGSDGTIVASTLEPVTTQAIVARAPAIPVASASLSDGPVVDGPVVEVDVGAAGRFWISPVGLGTAGAAIFVRSIERELAALPRLRQAGLLAAGLALLVTLLVGFWIARQFSRPIRALSDASRGLAAGDFDVPLPVSRVSEVTTVSGAFGEMRTALAARLGELADANRELADRQERLQALQTELIQRDRLVAAGRLVTELAHEIRNPVANVRNSLEVVRRHVDTPKAREFTDLAIRELLRMHELAERMLDLNRPSSEAASTCDARTVVHDVAALASLGDRDGRWELTVDSPETVPVAIRADSLKQVLLNLVTNAQEASPEGGVVEVAMSIADEVSGDGARVRIEVRDRGAGIPDDVLPRIFDPFFTTKQEVHGVGLGLFIAEGVVRGQGGSMVAANREPGPGATITIELPRADAADLAEDEASATPKAASGRSPAGAP